MDIRGGVGEFFVFLTLVSVDCVTSIGGIVVNLSRVSIACGEIICDGNSSGISVRCGVRIVTRSCKNLLKVSNQGVSKLFRGGRMSSNRILQVSNSVFPMTFSY